MACNVPDGPENFGIAEEYYAPGSSNTNEFPEAVNLFLNRQFVPYTPQNGTGVGNEETEAAHEFGKMLNKRNPKTIPMGSRYSSSIAFKSSPKKLATGESITMRFGAGVDTLYDKPAISEFTDMTKNEDEDLELNIKWIKTRNLLV